MLSPKNDFSITPPRPIECHKRGQKECKSWGWGGECCEMCMPGQDTAHSRAFLNSPKLCFPAQDWTPPSPFHHGRIHKTSCLSEARVTVTVNSSPERKHLFLHGRTTGHFPVLQEIIPHRPRSMRATLIKPRGYKGNKDKDCRSRKGTCWEDTQQWEWKEVERGKWG